jgi:hypothetical protein
MSADTRPIDPARFASALKELSLPMLHLKVLEIRNSIAHLQYSNDQLRPFAEGSAVATASSSDPTTTSSSAEATAPDQDCVDAIQENLAVIDRMAERIALVRAEVEERGISWTEFQSAEEVKASQETVTVDESTNDEPQPDTNGSTRPSPWTDGTFQTGVIRNGEIHMDAEPGQRQHQSGPSVPRVDGAGAQPQGQGQGGGSISDDELRRAMEERMRNLGADDDDNDGGMHL